MSSISVKITPKISTCESKLFSCKVYIAIFLLFSQRKMSTEYKISHKAKKRIKEVKRKARPGK